MLEFYSLSSGSNGNCLFVCDGKTKILIDCGLSGKRTAELLNDINVDICSIDALLVTHEHTDHIKGVGVLSRKYDIPVYARGKTLEQLGGIKKGNVIKNNSASIGTLDIEAFSTIHDAADPCGFNIMSADKKITVATDLGIVTDEVLSAFTDTDFAFVEANHDINMLTHSSYPYELKRRILSDRGHLSNKACADLVCRMIKKGTKKFMLGHLSIENNMPELAYSTVVCEMELLGIRPGVDAAVSVAEHFCRSESVILQ